MSDWHFVAPPNEAVEKTMGITRCGKCGRVLTDPESVAKGIGPVCEAHGVAKHLGPGSHPSGSSQSVHAGGKGKQTVWPKVPKSIRAMSPAKAKRLNLDQVRGLLSRTTKLLAQMREAKPKAALRSAQYKKVQDLHIELMGRRKDLTRRRPQTKYGG